MQPCSTIVTMFFNLKHCPDATDSTRSLDFYLEHGRPTLALPYPMVVFCDEETLPLVRQMRPEGTPTAYIVKPFTEYDFYTLHYPLVEHNRATYFRPEDPRNTSSYFLLSMFKIHCLFIAKQRNDFDTPFYAWIDFGSNHIMKNVADYAPKMLENPNPKISACYIHYRNRELLREKTEEFLRGQHGLCGMAAGIITADRDYIDRFYHAMMQIFHSHLYLRLGHAEEQVLTCCYDRFPELFTLYYGDYYSLLTNYHEPIADLESIRTFFIQPCLDAGRMDLANNSLTD